MNDLVPDRIIDEDTKLWRFRSVVVSALQDGIAYRFRNPVPVTAGGKLVGFASVWVSAVTGIEEILADVAVDYAIPERLDVENGRKYWTLPRVEVYRRFSRPKDQFTEERSSHLHYNRVERVCEIQSLQIRDDGLDPAQAPIGGRACD